MDILFLGDSITDCSHNFTPDHLGEGYVKMISQDFPEFSVTNGGSDGFTFPRTFQKWSRMYALHPYDCAVITGGINEAGVIMNTGLSRGQAAHFLDHSQDCLRSLLAGLLGRQTARIVLVEPFLFPVPQYRISWLPVLEEIRSRIQKTASEFSSDTVLYLPVQDRLDGLAGSSGAAPYDAVTTDGVHLTRSGHRCLADAVSAALCGLSLRPVRRL